MIDVEEQLTLDERSALDFSLDLRKNWAERVYPALVDELGDAGSDLTPEALAERVHGLSTYPWFSHLERAQQKMMWRRAGEAVLARRDELLDQLEVPATAVGSLTLAPELELPDWYTRYDIHVQPGSFYSDDMSAYVYELGARIVMLRDNDGYKFHRLFAESALPDIPHATQVVDVGCGFGKSTRPLVGKYPNARVVGFDLAAPGLRLAHAEAAAAGLAIDFIQAGSAETGLPDGTCDVVTGTMVLHEMPGAEIVRTVQEAARILKPGGAICFLEFQPTGDPVRDLTVYEHAERNNEPYFRDLFETDVVRACREAGLVDAAWLPFDERVGGISAEAWNNRPEWHFPWAVLSARKDA